MVDFLNNLDPRANFSTSVSCLGRGSSHMLGLFLTAAATHFA